MTDLPIIRKARRCRWCREVLVGVAVREGRTGYDRRGSYYHESCLAKEVNRRVIEVWPTFDSMLAKDFHNMVDWMVMRQIWQVVIVQPPVPGRGVGRPKAPEDAPEERKG